MIAPVPWAGIQFFGARNLPDTTLRSNGNATHAGVWQTHSPLEQQQFIDLVLHQKVERLAGWAIR